MCLMLLMASGTAGAPQDLLSHVLSGQLAAAGASSVQEWIDTSLSQSAGAGAEWYVIALAQSGSYDFSAYQSSLRAYLSKTTVHAASSRQKFALALSATGAADAYIAETMENAIGQQGVMSWIYGLHLLNNGHQSSAATVESAVDILLSLQFEDGGWALMGSISDVDVTAMALQALAPHAAKHSEAIDRALALLSSRQMADGGYASFGTPNCESSAQVIVSLCSLGIDPFTDERFIKNGCTLLDALTAYQLPDGSFSHLMGGSANYTATAQVFYAMTAYQRLLDGKSGLYLLDRKLPESDDTSRAPFTWNYKLTAALSIGLIALIVCAVLFFLHKRHHKNFAAVLVSSAVLILLVYTLDFQSADSYYSGKPVFKEQPIGVVHLSIRCDTVAGQASYIPADGVILPRREFTIAQGDTVYDILTEAAQENRLHLESSGPAGMVYVTGIANLYEHAFGDLSGWTYLVNGLSPAEGCDQYFLSDGDEIAWLYTCELGRDLN